MIVKIVTLESVLIDREVKSVVVPGKSGRFEMLNNHASIVSLLTQGNIQVTDLNNKIENFNITGGSVEMSDNNILILADTE
jgi:F-type H+-transporting ATPase subunit epsilon